MATSALHWNNGSDAVWTLSIASRTLTVTNITQAANAQVTFSTAHGLQVGDHIHFRSVGGMTQMNSSQDAYETGTIKRVASVVDSTNVTLDIDSTSFSAYTSGGTCYQMGVQRVNNTAITVAGHSIQPGQRFLITGVGGAIQINNQAFIAGTCTTNAIRLLDTAGNPVDGSAYSGYTSGGTVTIYRKYISAITKANPAVVTCNSHGFTNGQLVYITGCEGMTEVNDKGFTVANATTDTFELSGINSTSYGTYTSGGTVRRPWNTFQGVLTSVNTNIIPDGEEVRMRSTAAAVARTTANCTWTMGTNTITTSASLVGTIAVGDFVGRQGSGNNGNPEKMYRVNSINSTTITIQGYYWGPNGGGTDTAYILHLPNSSIESVGSNNASIIANSKAYIIKGGYDATFENQDGETNLKHAFGAGTSNNTGYYGAGSIDRVNMFGCYRNFYLASTGATLSNLSSHYTGIYNIEIPATGSVLENVVIGATSSGSYESLRVTASSIGTWDEVYISSVNSSSTYGMTLPTACTIDCSTLYLVGCGTAVNFLSGATLKNVQIDYCVNGLNFPSNGPNGYAEGITFGNAIGTGGYNVNIGTQNSASTFKDCSFANTNTLVNITQSSGARFIGCTFTGGNYHVSMDQYSHSITFEDCDFITPNNYALYQASAVVSNVIVKGCTIDAPSLTKAYNIPASDSFSQPAYILENSFGKSGAEYNRLSLLEDTSEYYSVGPSVKLIINSSTSNSRIPIPVLSCFANSGVARTFTFYMKKDATAFSGSITPEFYLNGVKKTTETSITSLTTGWVQYSYTIPSGSVSENGHLELRFQINVSSLNSIWISDFTVT